MFVKHVTIVPISRCIHTLTTNVIITPIVITIIIFVIHTLLTALVIFPLAKAVAERAGQKIGGRLA